MEAVTKWPHKLGRKDISRQLPSPVSAPSKMCNVPKMPDLIFISSSPSTSKSYNQFSSSQQRSLRYSYFADDKARFFVVAQSFECSVAEQAIVRPFIKTNLRDELWFEPT